MLSWQIRRSFLYALKAKRLNSRTKLNKLSIQSQGRIANTNISSNMSKTRASASSRVPNTEKQMKARGRVLSSVSRTVFGTRDEARSPSFWHVFSNETIRNYVVTCFLKSNNDKLCSASLFPFTEKARLHSWWIVVVQLASDHEWRRGVVCKV